MNQYSFEKLNIWNDIRDLVKEVYLISKDFPDSEKFGLTNQIRRAIVSVSSNIAEGTSRTSYKDQAHFSQIAYSSLMEVLSQLIVSYDLNYINRERLERVRLKIDNLAPRISSLRNSQLARCK